MDELAQRLAAGPAAFPHAIDAARDMLLLIGLDEDRIAQASFLDQRILSPQIWGRWLPFADVAARLPAQTSDDAHYIFHIGHVGSTLISRLLGEVPGVLALREPQLLRDLSDILAKKDAVDAPWDPDSLPERIRMLRRMLARRFRSTQQVIVKATSYVSEIAPHLVTGKARALLLYVSPWSYLTTILAGENSRQETGMLAGSRLARLGRRIDPMPFRLWSMTEGERIAMSWLSEMLSLRTAADTLPDGSVLWVDFDDFLASPAAALRSIGGHFGMEISGELAERLVNGPIMQRYSKAPEHAYSGQLRLQLQRQAAKQHSTAIAQGLAGIESLAQTDPQVARVLRQAAGAGAPA